MPGQPSPKCFTPLRALCTLHFTPLSNPRFSFTPHSVFNIPHSPFTPHSVLRAQLLCRFAGPTALAPPSSSLLPVAESGPVCRLLWCHRAVRHAPLQPTPARRFRALQQYVATKLRGRSSTALWHRGRAGHPAPTTAPSAGGSAIDESRSTA